MLRNWCPSSHEINNYSSFVLNSKNKNVKRDRRDTINIEYHIEIDQI